MEAIYCIVRGKGQQGIGGNCTVRSVVICTCQQFYTGDKTKRRMRWAGHVTSMGEKRIWCENLKETDQ